MTEIGKHSIVASVHPIFFCVSLMQRYFSKMASGLNCLKVFEGSFANEKHSR